MSRARSVIAGALVLAVVIAALVASAATRADAAPSGVIGPTETFTGTVVGGTIIPFGPVVRFNVERPSLTNPAELEQLTVESAQASLVIPGEILSIIGNYDTDTKVFKATSIVSLGNANPERPSAAGSSDNRNDNSDSDDNDNNEGNDNGNDND
jgi:hypothetical protein